MVTLPESIIDFSKLTELRATGVVRQQRLTLHGGCCWDVDFAVVGRASLVFTVRRDRLPRGTSVFDGEVGDDHSFLFTPEMQYRINRLVANRVIFEQRRIREDVDPLIQEWDVMPQWAEYQEQLERSRAVETGSLLVPWECENDRRDAARGCFGCHREYSVQFADVPGVLLEIRTYVLDDIQIALRLMIYAHGKLLGTQYTMISNVGDRPQAERMDRWVAGEVFSIWQRDPTPRFNLPEAVAKLADPVGARRMRITC